MTSDAVPDQLELFTILSGDDYLSGSTMRERRLLVGALNFHALMAPGRTLTVHLYVGDWDDLPRTTDDSTFDGLSRAFDRREATLVMQSKVTPEQRRKIEAEAVADALVRSEVRHLHISRDAVLDREPPRDVVHGAVSLAIRRVRRAAPLFYDELRDLELLRHRRSLRKAVQRRDYQREFEPGGAHSESEILLPPVAAAGAPRAVLLGLHWFELGGAERWAFETVRLVREAGLLPIVVTDRDSHHAWVSRPELDGAFVIPFSSPTSLSQTDGVEQLLRALVVQFDIRGVVVHHNQWLYDRLPWLARARPGIPIVDSTHIVEYRGGGFPVSSAIASPSITTHHVISPTLARWMRSVQRVPAERIVMAPLGGLTVSIADSRFRERRPDEAFTVAFIGRLARQKAPEVFIAMAARIRQSVPDVRFIMHGDGELSPWVDELISSHKLDDAIERRTPSTDVEATLTESHLLVTCSHNEGLTLTTLEAVAHGVPVVSTDVGAQADIVPSAALIPRDVHRAVRQGARRVISFMDESARRELWQTERDAEQALLRERTAIEWFTEEVRSW